MSRARLLQQEKPATRREVVRMVGRLTAFGVLAGIGVGLGLRRLDAEPCRYLATCRDCRRLPGCTRPQALDARRAPLPEQIEQQRQAEDGGRR